MPELEEDERCSRCEKHITVKGEKLCKYCKASDARAKLPASTWRTAGRKKKAAPAGKATPVVKAPAPKIKQTIAIKIKGAPGGWLPAREFADRVRNEIASLTALLKTLEPFL